MTLTLELSPDVENDLKAAAAARGVAVEAVAVERLRSAAPETRRQLDALDDLLRLGARLTAGTLPLSDDAVSRSYEGAA